MIRRMSVLSLSLVLVAVSVFAADNTFVVKYLSAENVYLSGGQADGLNIGDHLIVIGQTRCRAEIEVVFLAEHSASCRLLSDSCAIAVGDQVTLVVPARPDTISVRSDTTQVKKPDSVSAPAVPAPAKAKFFARPAPANLSGTFSIMYYHWNDQGASNLDFSQGTARLNLKARRLFGKNITFSLRTRGRYDNRQRAYSSLVSQNAWENRIWEFSFSNEDPASSINFSVGRVLSRRISSAGYLDGLLVEQRVSPNFRVGLFGGAEPQWAYADEQLSLSKGGGYLTYLNGDPGKSYIEQSLAIIGQYHGMNVSRELIASQGRYSSGSRWGYYHTAEIDINRGWRQDKAGQSLTLSSLYLGTYYRVSNRVRLGLSYDDRKNYWTYDIRSTVDSLFDDHLRQGIRVQMDLSLPGNFQTSGSYGINHRAGDPSSSKAYFFFVNKGGLLRRTTFGTLQYSGFRGPFEHGNNYSVRLADNLFTGTQLALGYGVYDYTTVASDLTRNNHWVELSLTADLSRRYFFLGSVESDRGDDIKGTRIQAELGYRF